MPSPNASELPHAEWGPFRLIEKLGQGGFGDVYRAFDTKLEREIALKLLRASSSETTATAVLREARLLARVRHPNVVPVYGVDCFDDRVGFWSDLVRGRTLSALLAVQGRFSPQETTLIGIDVCKAVSAVHAAGLLHRDIKSSNVMREDGGRILLMDFGLSHAFDAPQMLGGTPAFMAPELFRGEPATVATDIYALGALLFQLLAGKPPVGARTAEAIRRAHSAGERTSLYDERTDIPEKLAKVVETALAPDPRDRFSSAGQMITALTEAAGLTTASFEVPVLPAPAPRRRWMPFAVAGAVLLLAASFYWLGPLRSGAKAVSSSPAAHSDFLQAQDLLDRYYRPNNIERAIALFRKSVAADPSSASGHAGLCRALWMQYLDSHDTTLVDPAKVSCARAVELDPDNVSAHITLGMIETSAGSYDLASEELKRGLNLNARSADAWSALADLYQKEGRLADVEPSIQKAIDLAPGAWRYLNQLGLYYLAMGKNAEAAAQFEKATALNPDNARAWNNLGIALRRQNRLEEARSAYQKSLAITPAYNTLSNLGTILRLEGRKTEAIAVFQRAVEMNPSSYASWGNLASAQAQVPAENEKSRASFLKAIDAAEKERDKTPGDATVIAELGSFYAAVQMSEKALPLLRQAIALAGENPRIQLRAAEGFEVLHQRQDALRCVFSALDGGVPIETIRADGDLAELRKDPHFLARAPK
jgi:serine/threonine-protein kinase